MMINIFEIKINNNILDNEYLLKELFFELKCALFLVDLTSEESFSSFISLITKLKECNIITKDSNYLTTILVLNKSDLEKERKITEEKIKEFLDSNPLFDSIEISLKTQNNIPELNTKIYNSYHKKENLIFPSDYIKEYKKDKKNGSINNFKLELANNISCLLIGDSYSGKFPFMINYMKNNPNETFLSTIGIDKEIKYMKIKDKLYKFTLWDSNGEERFRSYPKKYIQNADGFFVFFDANNYSSFDLLENWLPDINTYKESNSKIYLIGIVDDVKREITKEEGMKKAKEYGAQYFECNNKLNLNINEIVSHMIMDCYNNMNINNKEEDVQPKKERKNNKKSCLIY